MMFLIIFFTLLLISAQPIGAQTSLYYQLIEAYQPSSPASILPAITTPTPPPTGGPAGEPTVSAAVSLQPVTSGKTVTIAVLGDSMIDTLQPGLPQLKTALGQYFPGKNFKILNYGVGGRDIEYGLYRLTNDYDYQGLHFQSLISQNPDVVVVESFAYNNFGNSQAGINQHWLDLGAITTTLKTRLPHAKIVIAATIAPNSVTFGNGIPDVHFTALEKIEKTSTIKLYLQNAVNFANSQGFPLADVYHPSLVGNEGLPDLINAADNLHPSGPGGQFFCDTLAKTISQNHLVE